MGQDVFCASSWKSGVPSGWGRIIANDDPQVTPGDAMRRLARLAGFVLAITILFMPALASDKANAFYKQGVDAEARSNYEQAYDFYKQAYDLKPKEVKYRAAFTRIRFYASASHVHKGQQLRDQGHLEEALAEFQTAVGIDPANFYAAQELKRTHNLIEDQKKNPGQSL